MRAAALSLGAAAALQDAICYGQRGGCVFCEPAPSEARAVRSETDTEEAHGQHRGAAHARPLAARRWTDCAFVFQ